MNSRYGGSLKWGIHNSWMVYNGKNNSKFKIDDNWGYPHFRKSPYIWANYKDLTLLPQRNHVFFRQMAEVFDSFTMFDPHSYRYFYGITVPIHGAIITGWWFGTCFIFPNSWDDDPIWLYIYI